MVSTGTEVLDEPGDAPRKARPPSTVLDEPTGNQMMLRTPLHPPGAFFFLLTTVTQPFAPPKPS